MSVFVPPDDRVRAIHFLKKIQPADGKVVRVEEYKSDIYGVGPESFIWDPELSAPRSDQDNRIASTVDGFMAGQANEGAWDLLAPISPIDGGSVIANPDDNQPRGLFPSDYASTDECVEAAVSYVGRFGNGIVRLPISVTPLDYDVVSTPPNIDLVIAHPDILVKFDDTFNSKSTEGPGAYIGDTSSGAANLEIQEDLEVHGTEITVKRNGANALTVSTATDATVRGSNSDDIPNDGDVWRLVYDQPNDNWEQI